MKVFYEIEFCIFGEFGKFFIIESISYFKASSVILVFTLMNRVNDVKSIIPGEPRESLFQVIIFFSEFTLLMGEKTG